MIYDPCLFYWIRFPTPEEIEDHAEVCGCEETDPMTA